MRISMFYFIKAELCKSINGLYNLLKSDRSCQSIAMFHNWLILSILNKLKVLHVSRFIHIWVHSEDPPNISQPDCHSWVGYLSNKCCVKNNNGNDSKEDSYLLAYCGMTHLLHHCLAPLYTDKSYRNLFILILMEILLNKFILLSLNLIIVDLPSESLWIIRYPSLGLNSPSVIRTFSY